MTSVSIIHNLGVPPMPADERMLRWVPVGCAVYLTERQLLSVSANRQVDSVVSDLELRIHLPGGFSVKADTPEQLRNLTSYAVVRCVERNLRGPVRVLVEIGDMVAFPQLRQVAA